MIMTLQHRTPINPSSLKIRFAYRFLRALKNLKKSNTRSNSAAPSSTRDLSRTSRRVKLAAYASMASAVGSRRAWSRAILQKLRNSTAKRGLIRKRRNIIVSSSQHVLRRRKIRKGGDHQRKRTNPNPNKKDNKEFGGNQLKKLVPGGEAMDMCKLLDETAHYVKCLATQVEVMRNMVNFYSL